MDRIRKVADNCTNLQGFILQHSLGGGTGSGLTSLILERLRVEYGKKPNLTFCINPSPNLSTSTVEPYNTVLGYNSHIENSNCSVILDNEALYDISRRKLNI